MLVAELHGKSCPAVRDSEDALTAAVFGHLRYVPPGVFWDRLLARARGIPVADGSEPVLLDMLNEVGLRPSAFDRMAARFWPTHPTHGEPDLVLVFGGAGRQRLVLLVEAKLWSGKTGSGEQDQLARYLRALDDLGAMGIVVGPDAVRFLIYLTPRESLPEVADSVLLSDSPEVARERVFRLRWQDVREVALAAAVGAPEPSATILADVSEFLGRLGLEYFSGFRRVRGLPTLTPQDRTFFGRSRTAGGGRFTGFARLPDLGSISDTKGAWVR